MAKRWSEEIKAAAMADIAAGMTVKAVAEKYGMPLSTAAALSPSSKAGALKIQKILDLQDVKDVFQDHIAVSFAAQKQIMLQVFNAKWMARQSASELTAMYATFLRSSGKLLGALYGPDARSAIDTPDSDAQDTPSETG